MHSHKERKLKWSKYGLYLLLFPLICCVTASQAEDDIPLGTVIVDLRFETDQLEKPMGLPDGLTVLPDNTVLFADLENNRLLRFTEAGEFIESYGSLGSTEEHFYRPRDVVCGEDRIYVADQGNKRVAMLSFDLKWLGAIPVEYYPDIVVPYVDGSVLIGAPPQMTQPALLIQYNNNGEKLDGYGTLLGNTDDLAVTVDALNIVTACASNDGHVVVCYKGLAHCKCDLENAGWMIKYDVNDTRDWFYQGTFPDRELASVTGRNSFDDFIQDIRDKCEAERTSTVPLFVDDVVPYQERLLVVVSSAIHEYTYEGELLRRTALLDKDGKRVVFERLAIGNDNHTIYVLAKYLSSSCWRALYR